MRGECEIIACLVPLYWPAGLVCSIVIYWSLRLPKKG